MEIGSKPRQGWHPFPIWECCKLCLLAWNLTDSPRGMATSCQLRKTSEMIINLRMKLKDYHAYHSKGPEQMFRGWCVYLPDLKRGKKSPTHLFPLHVSDSSPAVYREGQGGGAWGGSGRRSCFKVCYCKNISHLWIKSGERKPGRGELSWVRGVYMECAWLWWVLNIKNIKIQYF